MRKVLKINYNQARKQQVKVLKTGHIDGEMYLTKRFGHAMIRVNTFQIVGDQKRGVTGEAVLPSREECVIANTIQNWQDIRANSILVGFIVAFSYLQTMPSVSLLAPEKLFLSPPPSLLGISLFLIFRINWYKYTIKEITLTCSKNRKNIRALVGS